MKPSLILSLAALSAAAPASPKKSGAARLQPGGFKFYVERRGGGAYGAHTTAAAADFTTSTWGLDPGTETAGMGMRALTTPTTFATSWYRNTTSFAHTTPPSGSETLHPHPSSEVTYPSHPLSPRAHASPPAADPAHAPPRDATPGPEPFPSWPLVHWEPDMNGAPPLTDTTSDSAEDWESTHMSDYSSNPSESDMQSNPAHWDQPPAWP